MIKLTCCRCKSDMWLPDDLYTVASKSPDVEFYCPYGHGQHFPEGESEEAKLRRERDLLKQRLAQKDDAISFERTMREAAERSASARKGQITRLKKRASAGVCPCCNRSFENLRRHMTTQHPQYVAEEVK